jgi:hypothetical protein
MQAETGPKPINSNLIALMVSRGAFSEHKSALYNYTQVVFLFFAALGTKQQII